MTFKKGTFLIQMNHSKNYTVEERTGWISDDEVYGFHKEDDGWWIATDLSTGACVTSAKTRKGCAEWLDENKEHLNDVRHTEIYFSKVDFFAKNKLARLEKEKENEK